MRIALLAPIWERVPPPAYGGIELVVSLLADRLVEKGHDVTLFATGDAVSRAELAFVEAEPLRARGLAFGQTVPFEIVHAQACFRRAHEFDVIHNHLGYQGQANAEFVDTPVLTTLHGPVDGFNAGFYEAFAHQPYVSISNAQRLGAPAAMHWVGTVYNGIDTDRYAPGPKGGYWLNLGRVSPEKGTHLAVEAARRTGHPLVIAGKIDSVDQAYYDRQVAPYLDGRLIRYIGEVGGRPKADLLAGAEALVHPVQWPEPFGLVMAEALASGTPVVACRNGAIPEVVDDGVTGFVVDSLEALIAALGRVGELSGAACRERAVARFGADRMASEYVAVYESLADEAVRIRRGPRASAPRPGAASRSGG